MNWESALTLWGEWMKTAGKSEQTISIRTYHVRRLARELGGSPASITTDGLVHWLSGKTWAPETRRAYRASLRTFYGWAHATGRVTHNPAHLLPAVKVPRARPRPTPEAVYRTALRLEDGRVRMAILIAGTCGLRRGELAKLRREDLQPDLTGFSLRVVGKGGHERLVPVSPEIERTIRAAPPGWLFPSPHGAHLTPGHLGVLVGRSLQALQEGLTTHGLRHRCGTVAYQATKDLRAVQELLGHAKPETTAIYTYVPPADVRAAMMAAV